MKKTSLLAIALCTAVLMANSLPALAVADRRFDVVTFQCPGTLEHHFCQPQFDVLNWVSANGHFLAVGSDIHKADINGNGNFQAVYYNSLNDGWTAVTGAQRADDIENWSIQQFPSGVPKWIIVNEISPSLWPDNATYRTWVKNVVQRLKNTYNHEIILCSPFPNPGYNNADWQAVSTYAYIGIECYLSGQEVNASGNSVSWCQTQYQNSKNSYLNRGVSADRLYLVEHFAQTVWDTGWGRSGVSYAGWDNAICARSQAAHNVGFVGFVSYAWAFNQLGVSDDDLLHFEDTYRQQTLP